MKYLLKYIALLRAFMRLGFWQAFKLLYIAPRTTKKLLIKVRGLPVPVTIRGKSSDPWLLEEILVSRQYGGFIKSHPNRILDGGANIGLATLYWNECFPDVEIVAVEPDSDNFDILLKNTEHLSNVTCIRGGLWPKKTKLRVKQDDAEKYAISVVEDEKNGTIDAYSIGSIMKMKSWDYIDVVKLDVEGAEVPILTENYADWIERIGVLIIELHQDIDSNAARVLFKSFSEQNFHLSWRGENLIITRF